MERMGFGKTCRLSNAVAYTSTAKLPSLTMEKGLSVWLNGSTGPRESCGQRRPQVAQAQSPQTLKPESLFIPLPVDGGFGPECLRNGAAPLLSRVPLTPQLSFHSADLFEHLLDDLATLTLIDSLYVAHSKHPTASCPLFTPIPNQGAA